MADPRKKKSTYRSNYQGYRPTHSNYYAKYRNKKQQDETSQMVGRFSMQATVCLCILMGVLILQKLPQTPAYQSVKTILLSEMPFLKYKNQYEKFLTNMFPFEFNLPTQENDTTTVSGIIGTTESDVGVESEGTEQMIDVAEYLTKINENMVLRDFHHGVIVKTEIGESIPNLVPGIVIHVGIDPDISNYMSIELDNDMILTVGFLEKRSVSLYEHVKQGESLGVGSVIGEPGTELGDYAYFYLQLEKDGEYLDVSDFLNSLMN